MKSLYPTFLFSVLVATVTTSAAVQVASPFGDHMVLQQGMSVPVWGTADAGELVTLKFAAQEKSSKATANGKWQIALDQLSASSDGRTLTVSGSATAKPITFNDVLVGEVWICGGQSNMERQLGPRSGQKPIVDWEKEVAAANHPTIRQFYVTQKTSLAPLSNLSGIWTVCSPATVADFTAVGYFFARDLQKARNVPVGIIHSSWGGTPAEAWTSREGLAAFPEFGKDLEQIDSLIADPKGSRKNYLARLDQWYTANDPGSVGQAWAKSELDTTAWEQMKLPVLWEKAGHPDFDGLAWFRKTFDLASDWSGRDLDLKLSAVDDIDTTWVNGTQIGATSGWNTPRTYRIPASLLKGKGNVIAVRVLDTSGGGGIWNTELPFEIVPADGKGSHLSLAGAWLSKFSSQLSSDYKNRPPNDPTQGAGVPTVLYNAMIEPLAPYAIRGATFYQGEANAGRAHQYRTLFPAMIADWRKRWGQGDFPFLFVQIAPFKEMGPEIREAQLIAWQHTKNTAMAVTIDVGDAEDIHPANKSPVGARLALAARALAYGEALEYSGPVFSTLNIAGNEATLGFTHGGGGLIAKDGKLSGFAIAGNDGVFHPAKAKIANETVIVSSVEVTAPTAVRYGWANVASGNLFNRAGLPAAPFRTDIEP